MKMIAFLIITALVGSVFADNAAVSLLDEVTQSAVQLVAVAPDLEDDSGLTLAQQAAVEIRLTLTARPELIALDRSVEVRSSAECGFIRHPDNSLTSLPSYAPYDADGNPIAYTEVNKRTPEALLVALSHGYFDPRE